MLQSIRDRVQGWLAGGIIAVVCITFALWGIHNYLGGSANTDVVAKVNGQVITTSDLNTAYQRLRQQEQMQLGAAFIIDGQTEDRLKKEALSQLIMAAVLAHAASEEGFRVTSDEVAEALLSIPAFQVNGRFSRDRFNDVLSSILYNEQGFLADLQKTMLVNQSRSGFIDSAFALPGDIQTAIGLVNQKRDVGYFLIPAIRFIDIVPISDQQAQSYYQQHAQEFTSPEQVSVDYLELSLPQLAASMHFSDDQLNQFYQDNLSNYTSPQRWHVAHILIKLPPNPSPQQVSDAQAQAQAIYKQLQAGASFSKLAQQYSQDPITAQNGGVLEWFSSGMVDPAFEKAATSLKQVNEISAPVQTAAGINIIKLLAIDPSHVLPFSKVKPQVVKALAQQQAEQLFADESDKLSDLTYANPSSLAVAAKALNLQVKTTGLFSRQGGKDEITGNSKVIATAFSSDVLQGNNSNVIALDPDTLLVIRVKQHELPTLLPFAQVKAQVLAELKRQQAQQQAQVFGQQLLTQIQQGKSPSIVAEQNHFPWHMYTGIGRYDSRMPADLIGDAFQMPIPNANTPSSAGFKLANGDYAVLLLTAVHDGSLNSNAAMEHRIYQEELEKGFGQLDYALYVRGILGQAKIDLKNIPEPNTASSS